MAVNIYKRKFGRYVKVGSASSEAKAREILVSRWGKGKYRLGKSYYITEN